MIVIFHKNIVIFYNFILNFLHQDQLLTPVLSPEELQGLLRGEVFLHWVVYSLDQHVR